jgi:lipopolysaccharide/colanic/teichoic acid biosynthesis glycosyltransferase
MTSIQFPRLTRSLETRVSASRLLDLIIATTALAIFSPIMILAALAIWFDSGRPIFFSQVRLGRQGRRFRIYKFRKFCNESAAAGSPLTMKNDARMTRPGRLLRKMKFDELPQLWNVLKGDMSIVGPRPESLDFADCFTGAYLRVLNYLPGIFGPSQVFFRNEDSFFPDDSDPARFYRDVLFPLKANIDLAYFPHRTIFSDIGWTMRGVLAVFGCRSLPPPGVPTGSKPGGGTEAKSTEAVREWLSSLLTKSSPVDSL